MHLIRLCLNLVFILYLCTILRHRLNSRFVLSFQICPSIACQIVLVHAFRKASHVIRRHIRRLSHLDFGT
jgi:hypothetical protein